MRRFLFRQQFPGTNKVPRFISPGIILPALLMAFSSSCNTYKIVDSEKSISINTLFNKSKNFITVIHSEGEQKRMSGITRVDEGTITGELHPFEGLALTLYDQKSRKFSQSEKKSLKQLHVYVEGFALDQEHISLREGDIISIETVKPSNNGAIAAAIAVAPVVLFIGIYALINL